MLRPPLPPRSLKGNSPPKVANNPIDVPLKMISVDNRPRTVAEAMYRLNNFGANRGDDAQQDSPEIPPVRSIRTCYTSESLKLSPEHIAEEELKARERYIHLNKEHQALRRTGMAEDSPRMQHSEKVIRDCYADIEYWERLGEEVSKFTNGYCAAEEIVSIKKKSFLGRNPMKSRKLDVDKEAVKARMAYSKAMLSHQELVAQEVDTTSDQWMKSQAKVNETLATLQYWESRRDFAVPPSI